MFFFSWLEKNAGHMGTLALFCSIDSAVGGEIGPPALPLESGMVLWTEREQNLMHTTHL